MIDIPEIHHPDSALALFTAGLLGATGLLCWVTYLLAKNTKEDFSTRKTGATVSAWSELRRTIPVGGFRKLNPGDELEPKEKELLRNMEYFSACVNSDVYDVAIFDRISGGWFQGQYDQIKLYVENPKNPREYSELRSLHEKITSKRARRYPMRRLSSTTPARV